MARKNAEADKKRVEERKKELELMEIRKKNYEERLALEAKAKQRKLDEERRYQQDAERQAAFDRLEAKK